MQREAELQRRDFSFGCLRARADDVLAEKTEAEGFTGLGDPVLLGLALSARTDLLAGNAVATLGALNMIIDELRATSK